MGEEFGVDLDKARAFLAEKAERRRARIDERYAQATRDARAIVEEIVAQVNPRRIYQWGSGLCSTGRDSVKFPIWTLQSRG